MRQNYQGFWAPSSRYKPNVMVDALPWRGGYDALFSHTSYKAFLLIGALAWLWTSREKWRHFNRRAIEDTLKQLGPALRLLAVVSFIFATCLLANRYDWVENDRLKFFLDPLFFLFGATCPYNSLKRACSPFIRR
jgi:hypothetical protein